MAQAENKTVLKMLDRLFAALVNGPSLNCRPHASRQRIDLAQIAALKDVAPDRVLRDLLAEGHEASIKSRVPAPSKRAEKRAKAEEVPPAAGDGEPQPLSETQPKLSPAEKAWNDQQVVLNKLRVIADDARIYEQDTGVHVLNVGFPILSLPPGSFGGKQGPSTRRILAPIAFMPVTITVKRGASQSIELACKGNGTDLVSPNVALLAWIEQQTGKAPADLFDDERGEDPWREIAELVRHVCKNLGIAVPETFKKTAAPAPAAPDAPLTSAPEKPTIIPPRTDEVPAIPSTDEPPESTVPIQPTATEKSSADVAPALTVPPEFELMAARRTEETEDAAPSILLSAVLGLFPTAKQGLLRDTQAMAAGESLAGPVGSFIQVDLPFDQPAASVEGETTPIEKRSRTFAQERLISAADPCQSRAVRLARESNGLVIHGPPGTGKSQTITNIVGDSLARGERVLIVCDKRTALDVVYNRLKHMGLGQLCGVVHDPQRDQRELYKSIRQQLDDLPDVTTDSKAEAKLAKLDAELQKLHGELTGYREALVRPEGNHGLNFHDLVGQWLALLDAEHLMPEPERRPRGAVNAAKESETPPVAEGLSLDLLDEQAESLRDILDRATGVEYSKNPWVNSAGIALAEFLAQPMDRVRATASGCVPPAEAADATTDQAIPPFVADLPLGEQGKARTELAKSLSRLLETVSPEIAAGWAGQGTDALRRARQKLTEAQAFLKTAEAGPLDAELALTSTENSPAVSSIGEQLAALAAYLDVASKWYVFFKFKEKSAASAVLNRFGLTLSAASAERVRNFLASLRARLILRQLEQELSGQPTQAGPLPGDEVLLKSLAGHTAVLDLLLQVRQTPVLASLEARVNDVLRTPVIAPAFLDGLRKSAPRAEALMRLEASLVASKLFAAPWLAARFRAFREGQAATKTMTDLAEQLDTLEGVLRVRQGLAALPAPLRPGADKMLADALEPERAMNLLRRGVLSAEITQRLAADPQLQSIDGQRLAADIERYRTLSKQKQERVRDLVLHQWVSKQKERLLAATGSRLNGTGAELRRRLTTRGERAMRLRQVVAAGRDTEGGDPLFDLCPVWMCSPETVAQVFPREAVFDAVIFDEASQCRLEEALPVLVRGKRVVIAGDPRQLPPTRFFESGVAASEENEPETDQDLFETHQGEVEDLLGAALGLDIQQCYLDVHYRSRNADLIQFSNTHFYHSRLQPIPGHPSNRSIVPPLTLYPVAGVYEKRRNEAEAQQVAQIVRDLLKRADPPSIGIACFNLRQRDLIVETLDEMAMEDAAFGRRLAEARTREGAGSFEGLFVKNLENVQGDERDHILISTTYGPDPRGKFYRRFGPLGMPGGGRRLNVLVTRARQEVHLITSIPPEAYRGLPPLEPGQVPGGGWLLFAYLRYAEQLAELYRTQAAPLERSSEERAEDARDVTPPSAGAEDAPKPQPAEASVIAHPTRAPSTLARSLADQLAGVHHAGSDVHWGNEGFCVDLALHHPGRPGDVTLGVMCDASRFTGAEDAIEWDVFRTGVLEGQGWQLHRVWSPHFFRDPRASVAMILSEADEVARNAPERDALPVEKPTGPRKR